MGAKTGERVQGVQRVWMVCIAKIFIFIPWIKNCPDDASPIWQSRQFTEIQDTLMSGQPRPKGLEVARIDPAYLSGNLDEATQFFEESVEAGRGTTI